MNRSDVFLSYRRKDVEFTKKIDQALKASGREVWVDWEDIPPGVAGFTDEIQQGIEGADAMIAILTPDYLDSEYCRMELAEAVKLNKRLIPIVLKKFDGYEVPNGIGHINWIYFTPHAGQENTWDESWPKVIQALETDFAHAKEHTRLMLRAKEWVTSHHETSYLLQGTELDDAEDWIAHGGELIPKPLPLHAEFILQSRKYENTRQQRQRALLSAGLAVSLVLLAAAVVLGIFAEQNRREAEFRTQIVEAETVAWDAELALNSLEPEKAAPLALFAVERYPARPYTEEVLGIIATYQSLRAIHNDVVDYDPDTHTAVLQPKDKDNSLEMLDITTNGILWTVRSPIVDRVHFAAPEYFIFEYEEPTEGFSVLNRADGSTLFNQDGFEAGDVFLSPDGQILAVTMRGVGLLLLETASWSVIAQLDQAGYFAQSSQFFSPDSASIVYATDASTLILQATTGEILGEYPPMDRDLTDLVMWSTTSQNLAYVAVPDPDEPQVKVIIINPAAKQVHDVSASTQYAWFGEELLLLNPDLGETFLFDPQTGDSRPFSQIVPGVIPYFTVSADMQKIAFPVFTEDEIQDDIQVWDAANGTRVANLVSQFPYIGTTQWTSDGQWLWHSTVGNDLMSSEFELFNMVEQTRTDIALNNALMIQADVAQIISPDQTRLVSFNIIDARVSPQILDAKTGQLLYTLPSHTEKFEVAWSPDSQFLVTYGDDRRFSVYTTDNGTQVLSATMPSVPFSLDWFTVDNTPHLVFSMLEATQTGSPKFDLRVFALPNDLYNLQSPNPSNLGLLPQIMDSGTFSPDGSHLLAVHNDGIPYTYKVDTNTYLHAELIRALPEVFTPEIAPDGYEAFWEDFLLKTYGFVPDWAALIEENYASFPDVAFSAAWSPDGKRIAVGSFGRSEDQGFTSDSRRSVGVGILANVRIWDAEANTLVMTFGGGLDDSSVTDVAWSPDGTRLLAVNGFGSLHVWSIVTGETLLNIQAHDSWAEVGEWSPDGTKIVTVSTDNTAKIWDANTGELLVTFARHTDWVRDVDWSPDGSKVVTAGWDKLLYVWDAASGAVITRYDGHSDSVNAVEWSPYPDRIISGSWDGTAQIWDSQTGDLLLTLRGHQGAVNSVHWSKQIVTIGLDNTMRLWQAWGNRDELEALVRECCLLQDLSVEETAKYQSAR